MIHREVAEAAALAGRLRDKGYAAQPYLSLGPKGFREIRAEPPDVILIDLMRLPSYGKAMGALLRESKSLREIPLAFLAGDPKKTAEVRRIFPDAEFAEWMDVPEALENAVRNARKAPLLPRVPSKSVAAKLGITGASVVVMLGAPAQCPLNLPEGTRIGKRPAEADVVMLWAHSEAGLDRELGRVAPLAEAGRRIWLLWPKRTSGVETSLTMPRVREIAIGHGLIDYKVCAVDATWSGIAVGPRRGRRA